MGIVHTVDQSQGVQNYSTLYSRPETIDSGTILQTTRLNGFLNYSTVDKSQWVLVLDLQYITVDQSLITSLFGCQLKKMCAQNVLQ